MKLHAAAVLVTFPSLVLAQTGPDLLLEPLPEDHFIDHVTSATILETGDSGNGDFRLGLDYFETDGRFPLPVDEDSILKRAQARVGYDYTHLHLDSDDPVLPNNLFDVSVGYGMGLYQSEDKTIVAGATVGLGYAAAESFGDGNGYYGLANLAVGKEFTQNGRFFKAGDRFGFVLNYDGNRTIFPDIPLPGFQYTRPLDEALELAIGFPFSSVRWEPTDKITVRVQWNIPDNFTGRVDYGVDDGFGLFAEVARKSEAFHSDELADGDDRILFQQSRVEAGFRYRIEDRISFVAAGGFAFDQEFNVGFDVRNDDEIAEPEDVPYVRLAAELRF